MVLPICELDEDGKVICPDCPRRIAKYKTWVSHWKSKHMRRPWVKLGMSWEQWRYFQGDQAVAYYITHGESQQAVARKFGISDMVFYQSLKQWKKENGHKGVMFHAR